MAEERTSADADPSTTEDEEPIEDPDLEDADTREELEAADEPEERSGSGPGFLRGTVLGVVAGAVAATLFAPPTGEEPIDQGSEQPGSVPAAPGEHEGGEAPAGRVQSVLRSVRARLDEARGEAREAAREAEAKTRARFEELTK